jgi:GNAT superfamily N-acetyltransferase
VTKIRIRACQGGDERALALVGTATFLETFAAVLDGRDILAHCANQHSVQRYRAWLAAPGYALWLAEVAPGDAPVGYMVVAPAQLPLADIARDDRELKRIYLLDRYRGTGTGRRLVTAAIEHALATGAKRLLLGVYARNRAAIEFYQRLGFSRLGARTFNVGSQGYEDDIMGLSLPPLAPAPTKPGHGPR